MLFICGENYLRSLCNLFAQIIRWYFKQWKLLFYVMQQILRFHLIILHELKIALCYGQMHCKKSTNFKEKKINCLFHGKIFYNYEDFVINTDFSPEKNKTKKPLCKLFILWEKYVNVLENS